MIHLSHAIKKHFDIADQHYRKHHTGGQGRNNIHDDFDEALIICHGRAWLILSIINDNMRGHTDPGGPTFDEMLEHAFKATFDDVLEAMYG